MLGSLAGMMLMWLFNLLVLVEILFLMCGAARLGGIFVFVVMRGVVIVMAVPLAFHVVGVLIWVREVDLVVMMVGISG
jgi:hypothetical protein